MSAEHTFTSGSCTSSTTVEPRACDKPDCPVIRVVTGLPQQKCTQFVTSPSVNEKPLLVRGVTSVFQVGGVAAKVSDIRSTDINPNESLQPVYRIKPNSHVHILNFIVVDDDSDVKRKIDANDPDTMRILVDSQRTSAEQKLRKLLNKQNKLPTPIETSTNVSIADTWRGLNETHQTQISTNAKTNTNTETTHSQGFGLSIASIAEGVPFNSADTPLPSLPTIADKVEISKMQKELQELRRKLANLQANVAHNLN